MVTPTGLLTGEQLSLCPCGDGEVSGGRSFFASLPHLQLDTSVPKTKLSNKKSIQQNISCSLHNTTLQHIMLVSSPRLAAILNEVEQNGNQKWASNTYTVNRQMTELVCLMELSHSGTMGTSNVNEYMCAHSGKVKVVQVQWWYSHSNCPCSGLDQLRAHIRTCCCHTQAAAQKSSKVPNSLDHRKWPTLRTPREELASAENNNSPWKKAPVGLWNSACRVKTPPHTDRQLRSYIPPSPLPHANTSPSDIKAKT